MMMAHHNNYNSNPMDGHMYETFDQVQNGKLDCSTTNFMNNGLAMTAAPMQMQSGFQQQQQQQQGFSNMGICGYNNNTNNNNNNNNCNAPVNQVMNFSNMEVQQPTMNFQQNNMGMNMSQEAPFMGQNNNMGMNNSMNMNMGMGMNSFMNQGMNNMNNMQQFQTMSTPLMNGSNAHPFIGSFTPCMPSSQQGADNLTPQQQLSCDVPTFITATNSSPTNICNITSSTLDSLRSYTGDGLTQQQMTKPKMETERRVSLVESNGTAALKGVGISILSSTISKTKELLPEDYEPTNTAVICGNKRKYFESKGNKRFREVSKMFIQEYAASPTKIEKSAVVSKVMNILLEDCPDGVCFVSPQGGRWYAVSERTAREKIGTYLRDCLSGHYLSSAKNKIARRKKVAKKDSSSSSQKTNDDGFSAQASSSFAAQAAADQDDGSSLGDSVSFYDVDDLTPVPL